jgi:hypothetical protein
MFIQTEPTPNPATRKFIPGVAVMDMGTVDFATQEAAARSPLASRLYDVNGVDGVFFGGDFITVTKTDDMDWTPLKPAMMGAIMVHFTSGQPLLNEDASMSDHAESDDDELVTQIKELLDTRVRPAVAQDGGDILFHGFERGVSSTYNCKAPARVVLVRRQRRKGASRACCDTTSQRGSKCERYDVKTVHLPGNG